MALYAFLTVKDVFVNLPTGSEKSIIYQLAPLVSSRLEELSPNSGLGKSDAKCSHCCISLDFTHVLCSFSSLECSHLIE